MNTTTQVILVASSLITCASAVTTLAIVVFAGKKAQETIEDSKENANETIQTIAAALANVKL